jgi:hypothetical protein
VGLCGEDIAPFDCAPLSVYMCVYVIR